MYSANLPEDSEDVKNIDYSARLDHLQLQSLERRRLVADLVLTYRIMFGLVDLNMSDYLSLQCYNSWEPI